MPARRLIQLLQLPIPQPGLEPAKGNVPLAAAYLKMYAERRGLLTDYDIELFPPRLSNTLSDCGLVEEILARAPWLVGFSCYLWNIDRTLWIASRLKERRPEMRIIVGGPEITADNAWVLQHPAIDFAAIGEGEQTFSELLIELRDHEWPSRAIAGLYVSPRESASLPIVSPFIHNADVSRPIGELPMFRQPLASLDEISSPYLTGILDAADEDLLLLETIRGCIFKCKFCYYPKSYDDLYFVSREKIIANLQHARERGVKEVVLLDPTLNQARNFGEFVRLLADQNSDQQWRYFGELRAEGINSEISKLLREANFTEVEIGLQSIDPLAMELMDRKNNMKAFEKGVQSLLDVGIQVKVDLIIGLPGDTPESVRRGMQYLRGTGLYSSVQVFNLAILPGTAFRQEAAQHGLQYQSRPPYYVTKTPTIDLPTMYQLMDEAEEIFETEFDSQPPPIDDTAREIVATSPNGIVSAIAVNLDEDSVPALPPPQRRAGAIELSLSAEDFHRHREAASRLIRQLLDDNPHSTVRIVLTPTGNPNRLTPSFLQAVRAACLHDPSYLDRFYSMQLGRPKGAKHIVIRLPLSERDQIGTEWIEAVAPFGSIVWHGSDELEESPDEEEFAPHEYVVA